ncbi:MAG: hypothetical protein LBT95_01265 [Treponema sp.]|nr:hypothetical protein [Treponema sp.]
MRKYGLWLWMPVLFLSAGGFAAAEEVWYFSNAAGMTLDRSLSRAAALRNKYALSAGDKTPAELPDYLAEYYDPAFTIELRTLYEDGAESRRQWVFKDSRGVTRLVSSGDFAAESAGEEAPPPGEVPEDAAEPPPDAADGTEASGEEKIPEEEPEQEAPSFFIEIYDENNLIIEEHQFSGGETEYITGYFYNGMVLVRAETRQKIRDSEGEGYINEALTTDYYRYSRSQSLRAVERIYHQSSSETEDKVRLSFPHMILDAASNKDFVSPGTAYGSDFLQDVLTRTGGQVVYTTDERGRILAETTLDKEGKVVGEIRNTWAGDRLTAVDWISEGDERHSEYDYDEEGDRIAERNYRNGVLERVIRRENGRETEELFMNGTVILRAIWEDGRKVSEEYFNPPRGREN